MAIRLPVIPHQTIEEQRQAYVESHDLLTSKLTDAIKAICDKHRAEYEEYLVKMTFDRLRRFLNGRNPNDTAKSFYTRLWVKEKMDYRSKSQAENYVREEVAFICKLTDHPVPPKGDDWQVRDTHASWEKNENRPDFKIKERADADKIVRKDVKAYVDGIVNHFVFKVKDKLADIIIHYKDYDCQLEHGRFLVGAFEGDVTMQFKQGASFRIHVMLKTNHSVYGMPYVQYPLTFHNVVNKKGDKPVAMCSETEVQDTMGIVPWKPVKQKKPFSTLIVGDIVERTNGGIRLVIKTWKDRITLIDGTGEEAEATVDDIKVIHARTKPYDRHNYTQPGEPWETTTYHVSVEMHNGRCEKIELGASRELYALGYGVKRDTTLRKKAFPIILAKWKELMVPPPPQPKLPRRRWR